MNYDPFELNPPKNLVNYALKQLRIEAKTLLDDIATLRQNPVGEWLVKQKETDHQQLINKIRRYKMYLDGVPISHDWTSSFELAKARPISDFYEGKLRRMNKLLVGKCPFHADNSPSFVIYTDKNKAHCFGCGWQGDSIDFIQKLKNLSFKAAIHLLKQ